MPERETKLRGKGTDELVCAFGRFYRELHPERTAFQWQLRLVRYVIEKGRWPDVIDAPTGSGKTCVVEVHVFLNGLAGLDERFSHIPRRLACTVNRRSLVDDQYNCAIGVRAALVERQWEGIYAPEIARGLRNRTGACDGDSDLPLFGIASLRGGVSADERSNEWRLRPTLPYVICATPDMLGSRLLFRGYGTSRYMRPVEAGLLAYDTVAFLDEAHLNVQIAVTLRQVARIESVAGRKVGRPVLQLVSSTATQEKPPYFNGMPESVGVEVGDFELDALLMARLSQPKLVRLLDNDYSKTKKGKRGADKTEGQIEEAAKLAARACVEVREEAGGGTVGCMVNTVRLALEVSEALSRDVGGDHVATVVGRMRPWDRKAMEETGILGPGGNEDIWFLVGTQTLEVGVDMDLSGLVTQIAPASALVQRAGRVNRFGKRGSGSVRMFSCDAAKGPYDDEDLVQAWKWLENLPAGKDGKKDISPVVFMGKDVPLPAVTPKRLAYERLELGDVDYLSCTSDELAPETDVLTGHASGIELWLEDELGRQDANVYVAVRRRRGSEDDMRRVLGLAVPVPDELFPVPIGIFRGIVDKAADGEREDLRVFRIDGEGSVSACDLSECGKRVVPGDVIVVDESAQLFRCRVVDEDGGESSADVYALVARKTFHECGKILPYCFVLERTDASTEDFDEIGRLLSESDDADDTDEQLVGLLARCMARNFEASGDDSYERALIGLCESGTARIDAFAADEDLGSIMAVVTSLSAPRFSETAQIDSGTKGFVLLEDHGKDVSDCARKLAETLGLDASAVEMLQKGALYHDEGKHDGRFQEMLRLADRKAKGEERALAKSRFRSMRQEKQFRRECGLVGWRHEQLSAAWAWSDLEDEAHWKRAVVARLAGTSHGRGRATFTHAAGQLLEPGEAERAAGIAEAAHELFDIGFWESLITETNLEYGFWGISYLEALVRIADAQVSSEGR